MQEKLFELLFDKDEVTWQNMIYESVRNEQMNPWDIDISLLSQRFLEMLKKLKKMDFRISGKILLAAALLLKIKSNKLIDEDLTELDRLFSSSEDIEEGFYEELEAELESQGAINLEKEEDYKLIPRTPQPRKRKISVYDLVAALNKALEVKRRRATRDIPKLDIEVPTKHVDITVVIKDLYTRIKDYFVKKGKRLTFSHLTPSDNKKDKVMTFVPLLHLTNQQKIDLLQEEHFGEIEILLKEKQ